MHIEFSGRHHRALYFRAVFLAYRPTVRGWVNRTLLAGTIFLGYTAYLTMFVLRAGQDPWSLQQIIWHTLAGLVCLYILAEPFVASLVAAIRLWKDPAVQAEWRGRITVQHITFLPSEKRIGWESFREVRKTSELLVLVTRQMGFLALPRYFFRREQDWQRLLRLAEEKVIPPTGRPGGKIFRR